ncbi:hypothetical protein HBI25_017600 [Parastagonospora nodorum]|nr:hypothetical protein HBI95_112080 [Parastagonospora nodorum]KAH5573315.1 hypothetical protein HBI25_017600 [Parastagonospora nodorum]
MTAGILSIPLIMTVYVATMWDVAFVHSTSQLKKMPRVHAYASARPGAVQYARSPHVARRGLNVNAQIWDFVNNKIFKSLAMVWFGDVVDGSVGSARCLIGGRNDWHRQLRISCSGNQCQCYHSCCPETCLANLSDISPASQGLFLGHHATVSRRRCLDPGAGVKQDHGHSWFRRQSKHPSSWLPRARNTRINLILTCA